MINDERHRFSRRLGYAPVPDHQGGEQTIASGRTAGIFVVYVEADAECMPFVQDTKMFCAITRPSFGLN